MRLPAQFDPRSGCGPAVTRRDWLQRVGLGFGSLALTSLLAQDGSLYASESAEVPVRPPAGKASRVICLFMGGGPSQVDTFDPKPLLRELNGRDVPESIAQAVPRIARAPLNNLLASPYRFSRYGESGLEVSELYPHLARQADDLCVIRSMQHGTPIHAPAEYLMLTGSQVGDRPSLGSWITYGMGSENRDLPEFLVFNSDGTGRPNGWGAGFLPARHQGTVVNNSGRIPNLDLPPDHDLASRRAQLDLIRTLNEQHLSRHAGHSELEARIRSYELSFHMQQVAPEAFDLSRETAETHSFYGLDRPETAEYGRHCLLARRLIERGVRFLQLRRGNWDAHSKLAENHGRGALATDRPMAALLQDLKQRGLWEDTLILWAGEFGRTPAAQGTNQEAGRDHSPSGYSVWLAGGPVRGGQVIGATDPVGYAAIERPVHPNDLHATMLHALGIDQHELYFERQNRRELVTVNGGQIVSEVFA